MKTATKNRLSLRLLVCQALGTLAGLMVASLFGFAVGAPMQAVTGSFIDDVLLVLLFAFLLNIPFFALAAIILFGFTRSVLAYPIIWCVCLPGGALVAALIAFPPQRYGGMFWIALIPLCALVAGVIFSIWQAKSPLAYVR
ncbi:MAG: hypothetical protein ACXWIW_08660 [Croceibacterium sp.]